MSVSRRKFLMTASAAAAATLVSCKRSSTRFSGRIVGANVADGHRIRTGKFPAPTESLKTDLVIAGGGIAGLAAAHRFEQRKAGDFLLIELESATGGNSASGRNSISAFPWGAHYVPLANEESTEIMRLFEELEIIRGHDRQGLPVYNEEYLCAEPMERLFDAGRWQDGLLPQIGINPSDRAQYDDFFARMETYRSLRGSDGKPAFAIPLDLSSHDAALLELDAGSMAQWMRKQGWNSSPLRWYVDYCCRDDYGAGIAHVSAWAGIHYFASRRGRAANADQDAVVTWPEGNGWLASRLAQSLVDRIRSRCVIFNIQQDGAKVLVDFFDLGSERSVRVETRGVVCAVPRFVAQRVVRDLSSENDLQYSPWMVANITLEELPTGHGVPVAWDNVARDSASLGYVVATHQDLQPVPHGTVLTHYWPLDSAAPRAERERAVARSYGDWCDMILTDFKMMHPGVDSLIRNIDVWLWGHGMIRPVPGFIWGEARRRMQLPLGSVVFAHSDMSGISIFEEAFTRGTEAADTLLSLI